MYTEMQNLNLIRYQIRRYSGVFWSNREERVKNIVCVQNYQEGKRAKNIDLNEMCKIYNI